MIETSRLILRQWQETDLEPYAKINADPVAMRYFPATLSREESEGQVRYLQQLISDTGWGFWAVELKSTGQFIGFVGLLSQDETSALPNAPLVEIGWRLAPEFWGSGYAPEAAKQALAYAFNTLSLSEVYSFTALQNESSRRVMVQVGMRNTHQDFDHPKLAVDHPLARHCLYKITKDQWLAASNVKD